MARNVRTQYTPVYSESVTFGKLQPWISSNKELHREIAKEQCTHWTKAQIAKAQKDGYFDRLHEKAMKNLRLSLLSELVEDEE